MDGFVAATWAQRTAHAEEMKSGLPLPGGALLISCLMSHVACRMSHVACLMAYVSCVMSHVLCLMSRLVSRVSCLASRVSRLVSCLPPSRPLGLGALMCALSGVGA
jgi:hypothetical protein